MSQRAIRPGLLILASLLVLSGAAQSAMVGMNLVVREDRRRGVHVEGLSEWVVRSPAGACLPELDDGERGQ